MEVLGQGLMAIGKAIEAVAGAVAVVYLGGIASKTFLIYTNKAKIEDFKDWFNFGNKKGGSL